MSMSGEMKKIVGMLRSSDIELRCAAIKILGELRPQHRELHQTLGKMLEQDNQVVRRYVVEAFSKNRDKKNIPYLLKLLEEETDVKENTINTLAAYGPTVLEDISAHLDTPNNTLRRSLMALVARLKNRKAVDLLIEAIRNGQYETIKNICSLLEESLADYPDPIRQYLYQQVIALLSTPAFAEQESVLLTLIRLIGHIGHPEGKSLLLTYLDHTHPTSVRVNALYALLRFSYGENDAPEIIHRLFALLDDGDYANIVHNVLRILELVPVERRYQTPLAHFADNSHIGVKCFCLRKLGMTGQEQHAPILFRHLTHPHQEVRETAYQSLKNLPLTPGLLLQELDTATDLEKMWTLARIFQEKNFKITPQLAEKFKRKFFSSLENNQESHRVYLEILKNSCYDSLEKTLLQKIRRFKKTGDFLQAERHLRLLENGEQTSEQVIHELIWIRLKLSPKILARQERMMDSSLTGLQNLLSRQGSWQDVLKAARQETMLDLADLYYLGFHFSERTGIEREFGSEVLRYLQKKAPRSKFAKNAKNKLLIEGISENRPVAVVA